MIPTRYIFWGINTLLVAAMVYSASVMAAHILEGALISNTPPSIQKKTGNSPSSSLPRLPLAKFQTVLSANVFRATRTAGTTIVAPSVTRAPKAVIESEAADNLPLRLTLNGTIVMGAASIAFVMAPGQRTEGVYHLEDCIPHLEGAAVGECTPAQAKLAEVKADQIAVVMNQNRYVVKMEEDDSGDSSPNIPAINSARKISAAPVRRSPQQGFASITKGNIIETRIPNAEVEKAFENFAGVVNQARVVPFMVDGAPEGFQIRKIVPGSIYQRLGLQNSDIIKSVNGESLTTADQALRLFSLFKNEQEISLEIQRGSKPFTLNYIVE